MNVFTLASMAPPFDAMIVAHGEPLPSDQLQGALKHATHTVVCDGALEDFYERTHTTPDTLIGDGDSVSPALCKRLGLTLIKVAEQDTNDLTKAVLWAKAQGWTRLLLVGLTGRREDHTLANISLLSYYRRLGLDVVALTPYGVFIPFTGEKTLNLPQGTQLSFFALEGLPMSATGVAYPFENRTFLELWEATLNEVTEPTVTVKAEGAALLYIAFERKD